MSLFSKAAAAYTFFRKAKKISTYGKLVIDSINENTRPGALMKLGIRGMLQIGGKYLGRSLTSHPYFAYHKAHLEALSQALNASSNHEKALEALNIAIRSADAVGAIASSLTDYQNRRNSLIITFKVILAGELDILHDYKSDKEAMLQITESGFTPATFETHVGEELYEWRARWCELFLDSLELLAMAQVELRTTEAAMQNFQEKMKALASGGSIGTIASYAVEQDQLWQQYDRAVKPQAGKSEKAVSDPTGFARDQVRSIQKMTELLGEECEKVMAGVISIW